MDDQILFSEQQRFKQIWLWLLLLALNAFTIYGAVQQIITGKQFGDKPMVTSSLVIGTCVVLLVTLAVFISRLDTQIIRSSIQVRLFPFQRSFKILTFDSIDRVAVRKYSPLAEYGGWGIRYGANGKAYNISGNQGIQLVFKNGDKLLIGTNKPQEAANVLNSIKDNLVK